MRALFALLFCLPSVCGAQHWAVKCGGPGNERVSDVKAGPGDVVFSMGEFGPGSSVAGQALVSAGLSDVFVMKQGAGGAVQWVAQAGGAGLDLAGRLCPGADGSVAVCGQFTGTADLFGTPVTAQGGGTDLFVAKLSAAGALLWVRTGGSAAYTDRAASVALGSDGRVVLTGEFRGTAVFDAGTFSSTIDPGTSLPGSDVFMASYASDGSAQWFKQGIAERDDQAADVVVDASGAAYGSGLYSETISFGVPHPNTGLNQIYLVKFDAEGNEQWFRRIGGAALQRPVDMQLGDGGGLYLCGETQGALTWFDTSPSTVPSAQPNAYFLVRAGTDGAFAGGIAVGSVNAVGLAGMEQHGATATVYGHFVCGFTDLQAHYNATGIFIATGEEDLFLAEHDAQGLSLQEAQQFGGHLGKEAGGITSLSNGDRVFCGGFAELLIFPSEGDGWGEGSNGCSPYAGGSDTYCGDAHYTDYAWIRSAGQQDGFIARGYVESRQPYDPYLREGSGCDRSALDLVLFSQWNGITDNSVVCGDDTLGWVPSIHRPECPLCFCPPDSTVSWAVSDLWSTGEDFWDTIVVLNSGWYWRTHNSSNGCYHAVDSIYVTSLPEPQAWVAMDGGPVFPGPINPYALCAPAQLLAADLLPGETFQWSVNGVDVQGNPIAADATGDYLLTVTGANGCIGENLVSIDLMDSLSLPNITGATFDFLYQSVPLDELDTVLTCGDGGCLQGEFVPTWYVDGVPTVLSQPIFVYYGTDNGCGSITTYPDLPILWSQVVYEDGWYPLHVHIVMHIEGCSDDTLAFDAYDSVYVSTGFAPQIQPIEDLALCPGDTAMVVLDCAGCAEVEWSGVPGGYMSSAGGDTLWVWGFGQYAVVGGNAGNVLCQAIEYFIISQAQPPPLIIEPMAVCPGDTALLYTTFPAFQYEWTGPAGPIQVDDDSLLISTMGAYYLTVYTDQGCTLFNGPAILQAFATPSLSALPDAVLCPGTTAGLVINGGGLTSISWNPPLSGSGLTQMVAEAGTYTCTVVACDETYALGVTIQASDISASIPPGPFTICGGGSVLLDGPTGDYDYLWTPGNVATEDLLVTAPGDYQLQITDSLGCTALSNVAQVSMQSFTQPLVATGDTVCAGDDALLSATGSGGLIWYAAADGQDTLTVGEALAITGAVQSDTVFVTQTEDDCTGPFVPVVLLVAPVPAVPVIAGDTSLCIGDALSLSVVPQPGISYIWSTPQGHVVGPAVNIAAITAADIGTYVCTASIGGCPGATASVGLLLEAGPEAPVIAGDTVLCAGDDLALSAQALPGITYVWTMPSGEQEGSVAELSAVGLSDAGTYVCIPTSGTCTGEGSEVQVSVQLPPSVPSVTGPDTLCDGEFGSVTVSGVAAPFNWVTPGGTTPGGAFGFPIWAATLDDSGEYGVVVDGGACPDVSAFVLVVVDACDVTLPNVFTPNGDGVNDYLIIEGTPGVRYYFKVYNRWGQLLYSPPLGESVRWNGRDEGNDPLPDGVYYYELIRVTFGRSRTMTGYIQLTRGR